MDTTLENQRIAQLQAERRKKAAEAKKMAVSKKKEGGTVKSALSFHKKVGEHWLILATAAIFDLFAIIPFISVVINFCFGLVLFLYFGPKKKRGGSELTRIALPIAIGSIFDFFISILPVNIAVTLIRIALS